MLVTVETPSLRFDGRDLAEATVYDDVQGYALLACPHCGTLRDARFPFCCELADDPTPARVLAPA